MHKFVGRIRDLRAVELWRPKAAAVAHKNEMMMKKISVSQNFGLPVVNQDVFFCNKKKNKREQKTIIELFHFGIIVHIVFFQICINQYNQHGFFYGKAQGREEGDCHSCFQSQVEQACAFNYRPSKWLSPRRFVLSCLYSIFTTSCWLVSFLCSWLLGSLGVPGAIEDSQRTADFIEKHISEIDEIYVSLDTHHVSRSVPPQLTNFNGSTAYSCCCYFIELIFLSFFYIPPSWTIYFRNCTLPMVLSGRMQKVQLNAAHTCLPSN